MGAVTLIEREYPYVMSWAQRLGVRLSRGGGESGRFLMYGGGRYLSGNLRGPAVSTANGTESAEAARFRALVAQPVLASAINAANISETLRIAPSLSQPVDAWLRDNGLMELYPLVASYLMFFGASRRRCACRAPSDARVLCGAADATAPPRTSRLRIIVAGYGHIQTVPAAYALHVVTPGTLFNPAWTKFEGDAGFAWFLERVLDTAKLPPGALQLGVRITSVARPPPGADGDVLLSFTDNRGVARAAACSRLLNTAAQTLEGLAFLSPDDAERAVFSKVFANNYATVALTVTPPMPAGIYIPLRVSTPLDLPAALLARLMRRPSIAGEAVLTPWSFIANPSPQDGRPTCAELPVAEAFISPPNASAPPATLVTYALSDGPLSAAAFAEKARAVFAADPRRTVRVGKVFTYAYFPRVAAEHLAGGWPAQLNALQGRRRTYHAGGLLTCWSVESAMRSGRDVAATFF
jgi:hypothetical protein